MRHVLPVSGPLDLDLTLTCGQAFRWRADGDVWSGVVGGSELRVRDEHAGALVVETRGASPDADAIARYFRLEEDPRIHLAHAEELRGLPGFVPLLGLRLLRQEPWETLVSFLCSAAANIRKITTCVEALSERWGEPIPGSSRRTFPSVRALASGSETDLRRAGLGFRAPYVLETARAIASERDEPWDRLRALPLDEARRDLMRRSGVGPKIADCVLLFGLDRLDAYPVDRWIRRATRELSSLRTARDGDLARWAERLGPGRGYLQQVLFHLRRTSGRPLLSMAALGAGSAKRRPPVRRELSGRDRARRAG
ncbi:MAG TPA: DNA glycosylase [Candidatus Eisenbacteria bacterium]|nr:DNA glycosylase [Candidatus Eisenbacteria bacterium]